MPGKWAVVVDGAVTNVILWDGETPLDLGPGVELIPEADAAKLPRAVPADVTEMAPDAGPDPDLAKLADAAERATTVAQLRAVVAALIERT